MTRTYKRSARCARGIFLGLSLLFMHPSPSLADEVVTQAERSFTVDRLELRGTSRTDHEWMQQYLGLQFPTELSRSDLGFIENKLLTTGVFQYVRADLIPNSAAPQHWILQIDIAEKWTTIPVIRGAYGGGTPLTVLGIYDTHSFGRLWTLGMQTEKYGDAPAGGVVWARAPRWLTGHHLLSFELWQDNRIRSLFDQDGEEMGGYRTRARMFRFQFLAPLIHSDPTRDRGSWQVGLDVRLRQQLPTQFYTRVPIVAPPKINYSGERLTEALPMTRLVYDDIIDFQTTQEGLRVILGSGASFIEDKTYQSSEAELFYFALGPQDINFAWHTFIAGSDSRYLQDTYFLGGLDSIRGIPDGAEFGNKAIYNNVELRHTTWHARYLQVQNVVFIDSGRADYEWEKMQSAWRTTAGVGMRFSIPQVYRLVFRIDYGWSLDRPGVHGITAGMNQFFQPYKPL